jgi:hypothetical protein
LISKEEVSEPYTHKEKANPSIENVIREKISACALSKLSLRLKLLFE